MRNPIPAIEKAIDRDFLALLLAKNRVGACRPVHEVLYAHAIPVSEYEELTADPSFEALVSKYVKQLNDEGFGVEQKAAVLHEMGLPIVFDILRDPEQPAMARLRAHEMLGDIAGKSKSRKLLPEVKAQPSGYQLVINITPAAKPETYNGMVIENKEDVVKVLSEPNIDGDV